MSRKLKDNFTTSPVVSSLPSYVASNADQLIAQSQFSNTTAQYITVQPGIKESAYINILSTSIAFRNANTCGFDPTSGQTVSQRQITCGHFAVNLQWCWKNMVAKYAEIKVKTSALGQKEGMPFEEILVNEILLAIQVEADKAFWQGDLTSGSGNLALNDGIKTIALAASSGVVSVDASSAATKFAQIEQTINAIPASAYVAGTKVRIFVSPEYLTSLALELVKANLYHYDPSNVPQNELVFPGTQIIVTAVAGLSGQSTPYIFAANENNIFWGCDNLSDEEVFDLWFSDDDRVFKLDVEFNLGAQIAFPNQFVAVKVG